MKAGEEVSGRSRRRAWVEGVGEVSRDVAVFVADYTLRLAKLDFSKLPSHAHTHTHAPTWETRGRERGREMRERKTCTEFRKLYRAALRGPRASAVNAERRMPQRIFAVSHATSLEAACLSHSLSLLLSVSLSLALLALSVCMHALPAGWQRQSRGGGDSSGASSAGCLFSQHAVRLFFVTFARLPFSFSFLCCLICYCYCCCCCLIKWLWEHAIRVHCQMPSLIDLYSRARPRLTRVATHWTRNGKFCLCFFDTEKRARAFCPTTFALAPLQTTADWRCCCRDLHFQPASRASGSSSSDSEESEEREQWERELRRRCKETVSRQNK